MDKNIFSRVDNNLPLENKICITFGHKRSSVYLCAYYCQGCQIDEKCYQWRWLLYKVDKIVKSNLNKGQCTCQFISQFTFECTCNTQCITNPYLAKFMELSLNFLFVRSATQFLCCWFRKFDIESTNNSQIDIFLYFHCSSAWYCIDIVWRNYASITRS